MLRDEEEKNARVILSEGEAEAAKVINEAVKVYGAGKLMRLMLFSAYLDIKRLEAAKTIAENMSKSPNITWIPTGHGVSNLLNLKTH